MRLKYLYSIIIIGTSFMAACSSGSDAVDDSDITPGDDTKPTSTQVPIAFSDNNSSATSRADGKDSLYHYIKDFIVYGINGNISGTTFTKGTGVVFPNYVIWYNDATSSSNTDKWEYVGTHPSSEGYSSLLPSGVDPTAQVIKYWDDTKNTHYFWAIGNAARGAFTVLNTDGTVNMLTTTVSKTETENDATCFYYADPKYVSTSEGKGKPVELNFHRYQSRIRIGFYEAVKYSNETDRFVIKPADVKFYSLDDDGIFGTVDDNTGNKVLLKGNFPTSSTVKLSYDYSTMTTPKVNVTSSTSETPEKKLDLGTLPTETDYLSQSSESPTWAKLSDGSEYLNVLPGPAGMLSIKCDYTITDTYQYPLTGDMMKMTGIVATIPEEYTNWQTGKEYTYIFKITENDIYLDICTVAMIQEWDEKSKDNGSGTGTEGW